MTAERKGRGGHRSRTPETKASQQPAERERWHNLWTFAQSHWPRACLLAVSWLSHTPLSLAATRRAEDRVLLREPDARKAAEDIRSKLRPGEDEERAIAAIWVMRPDLLSLLDKEISRRKEMREFLARRFIGVILPERLRKIMMLDSVEVFARTADGRELMLQAREIAGLDFDIRDSKLMGDGTEFKSVRVRETEKTGLPASTDFRLPIRRASRAQTLMALRTVYNDNKGDPPNTKDEKGLVNKVLNAKALQAPHSLIAQLSAAEEFASQRRKRGERRQRK